MTYHPLGKEYDVYEMYPSGKIEMIIAPAGRGNLETLAGVEEILDTGYKLVHHDAVKKRTEVTRISQTDRKNFIAGFYEQAIDRWVSLNGNLYIKDEKVKKGKTSRKKPIKVKHLKVVNAAN